MPTKVREEGDEVPSTGAPHVALSSKAPAEDGIARDTNQGAQNLTRGPKNENYRSARETQPPPTAALDRDEGGREE